MNRREMLVQILGEEGSEVSQMSSKINRFGMHEVFPDPVNNPNGLTNVERMHQELDDVMTLVAMLNAEYGFNYAPNQERMAVKKVKVEKYLAYSREIGTLQDDK